MQVILLERIPKLGQMGDIVDVRKGYARNYLLPQKKALRASKDNLNYFETQKVQLEARNLDNVREAKAVAKKLNGQMFSIVRMASDTGVLYGSVSTRDIAAIAKENGFSITHQQVNIDKPIKETNIYPISVLLHPEVEAIIEVNVARSIEEADKAVAERSAVKQKAETKAKAEAEAEKAKLDSEIASVLDDEPKQVKDKDQAKGKKDRDKKRKQVTKADKAD